MYIMDMLKVGCSQNLVQHKNDVDQYFGYTFAVTILFKIILK